MDTKPDGEEKKANEVKGEEQVSGMEDGLTANEELEYIEAMDMELCFTCSYFCLTYSTPPRITNRYGQTLRCADYMFDSGGDGELKRNAWIDEVKILTKLFKSDRRSERTKAGLERVKSEGKTLGRPQGSKDSKKRRKKRPVVYRHGGPVVEGIAQ